MKTTHASTMKTTSSPSTGLRDVLRMIGAVVGWPLLVLMTLVTGYLIGWILYALGRLGSVAAIGDGLPVLLVFLLSTVALVWLVGKFVASARSVRLVLLAALGLLLITGVFWTVAYPDQSLYWARQLAWDDSTMKDYELYPERSISNAPPAFHFKQVLSPERFEKIEYRSKGALRQMEFEEFLKVTQTTSFLVIRDDTILYEGYFNGYKRDSIVRSYSVAKSFTSALIGIAIDEGYIGSVDDRMIDYLPEMKGKGFDEVTLRDLLSMSAGIEFVRDDEVSALAELTQFTDEGLSYSYPNLRSLALQVRPDGKGPGVEFNYNDYHPLLLGMILERTTGRSPSEYLQEKLWKPLGMEFPASWSLDGEKSGFEQMGSGINARAIDFAKFGRLYLNNGNWNNAQVISPEWISESTMPNPADQRAWHPDAWFSPWQDANGYYKYMWWGRTQADGSYDYTALGHLGQYVYVNPQAKLVIVRFGLDEGGVDDWVDVFQSITARVNPQISSAPSQALLTSTPEEQGLDSAKLAEGLLAIKEKGTLIHSLMILRNDKVILDAYFYPYDGSIYHDLASVTKSVMTTLIGIAADQGKLSLDDKLLSFFPDREIANRDERKEKITIRHLASMSSGLDCDAIDDEVTMIKMRASKDWMQFALNQPVVREPGTRFVYCGLNMHLLSAILQKATGMTTLEFARANLFGPLGIHDVYWPADPQGVTHGWGDICLRPADMAKLGFLFLHHGRWDGKQIVSREWVEAALQRYMKDTGKVEDYGYGWWISPEKAELAYFLATGNGGQKIRVIPTLNMILVTTGSGVEPSEVEPYIVAAMGDMESPLPPNPAGVTRLNLALTTISKGPDPQPVRPLPAVAKSISGQTFVFEPGTLLQSLRLDFDDPAESEAIFRLEVANEPAPRAVSVGLDGVYRASHEGRPILARGEWIDEQTFLIDYNEGPGIAVYAIRLHFDGNQLVFDAPGIGQFKATKD